MKHDYEYEKKMLHSIPVSTSVDRIQAILLACKDKTVLDIGYAGSDVHKIIKAVAKKVYGVDKVPGDEKTYFCRDLDNTVGKFHDMLPRLPDVELIICGEVIEHLSNPGHFLSHLHDYTCPILISVPNAFSEIARRHLLTTKENVNIDHVAWYSYTTFSTLLTRYNFQIDSFWWYGGKPLVSEGLLFLVKSTGGNQ
jgi:2-polyprenyl-3-methyl-5-hydroxy-6-metoxy-1,4-benzoquinol methylase